MAKNNINVLFVDDEIRIVRSLGILFRSQYLVHTATSGREALGILKSHPIHVMVSDQRMPGMTGVELFKTVKRVSPNTIRILLTGYSDMSAIVDSINEGEVFRYINKPWAMEEMKTTIGKAAKIAGKIFDQDRKLPFVGESADPIPQDILVLDDYLGVSLMVESILKDRYRVFVVNGLDEALQVLARENVAVIIADIRKNNSNNIPLIKLLKREYPLAVTVVVTDSADSQTAIDLINQGQVYRYLQNIDPGLLRLTVFHAMQYYRRIKSRPVELARHAVEEMEAGEEQRIVRNFAGKWDLIRKKMFQIIEASA